MHSRTLSFLPSIIILKSQRLLLKALVSHHPLLFIILVAYKNRLSQIPSVVSYEGFDGPFSNINFTVKGKCSLRTFDKHSKFRYVTTKFRSKICAAVAKVTRIFALTEAVGISKIRRSSHENSFRLKFRYISPKSSEERKICLHSFCIVL